MGKLVDVDYWVEVPAGEAQLGLAQTQRDEVVWRLLELARPDAADATVRTHLLAASEKLRKHPRERLTRAEREAFQSRFADRQKFLYVEDILTSARPEQRKIVGTFYIARFPVTESQYYDFTHGNSPAELQGALDEPELHTIEVMGKKRQVAGRWAAAVRTEVALRFLSELGGRLPTEDEWEKAARGSDGRLYPWGNEWDETRGFFYSGQEHASDDTGYARSVTAFPAGISPYGAWAMAGGLPELVTVSAPRPVMTRRRTWDGRDILVDVKGAHPRESSKDFAWFDHIVALPGQGFWVSLRPVLDKWPGQVWRGHRIDSPTLVQST